MLSKRPSPFQSPSDQPAPCVSVLHTCRPERPAQVIAVEFAIEVGVAEPGVSKVLDPNAVVVLIDVLVVVEIERGIGKPPRPKLVIRDLAQQHVHIVRIQGIVRIQIPTDDMASVSPDATGSKPRANTVHWLYMVVESKMATFQAEEVKNGIREIGLRQVRVGERRGIQAGVREIGPGQIGIHQCRIIQPRVGKILAH